MAQYTEEIIPSKTVVGESEHQNLTDQIEDLQKQITVLQISIILLILLIYL